MSACACGNIHIEDARVAVRAIDHFLAVVEEKRSVLIQPMFPTWSSGTPVRELLDHGDA